MQMYYFISDTLYNMYDTTQIFLEMNNIYTCKHNYVLQSHDFSTLYIRIKTNYYCY